MYASTIRFLLKTAAIHNFLDLSRELDSSQDDPDSSLLMHQQLCKECQIRSLQCRTCRWLNSHKSLEELQELILIRNSISVRESPDGSNHIFVDFPFKVDIDRLFSSKKTNFRQACATSKTLFLQS